LVSYTHKKWDYDTIFWRRRRTADQKEVDFVLEKSDGSTIGIEVKLDDSVSDHDFYGLKLLREMTGERFCKGVVLYTGREIVPFDTKLWALPAAFLWE
jgi:predicted AAA+ superfamily ATPase